MVERPIDTKIRLLRYILHADTDNETNSKRFLLLRTYDTDKEKGIPRQMVLQLLDEFGVDVIEEIPIANNINNQKEDLAITAGVDKEDVDRLKKILDECVEKSPKLAKPTIRDKVIELIAREIGESATGPKLVEFLEECGVESSLICYPNTKWRMIFDVIKYLSKSALREDRYTLFTIIEESCHPLRYDGNKESSDIVIDKFNDYLQYDGLAIHKNDLKLYQKYQTRSSEEWVSKSGNYFETRAYISLPEEISELYAYWVELIELVRFYFKHDITNNELNDIYFLLITKIENVLERRKCGNLYERYKRPFNQIIGCEYEKNASSQTIMSTLHIFLGEITGAMLPVQEEVDRVRKENSELFKTIRLFKEKNTPKQQSFTEKEKEANDPIHVVIDEVKKDIGIKGFEEKVVMQKPSKKKIRLREFPTDLKWEEISIRFFNSQDVSIMLRDTTISSNYDEMGFMDEKTALPNKQWALLRDLSERNGEISWENNKSLSQSKINQMKKRKQLLSESLRAYFQLETDPFHNYRKEKAYKIKITLLPEDSADAQTLQDNLGIEEHYVSKTPSVYDG